MSQQVFFEQQPSRGNRFRLPRYFAGICETNQAIIKMKMIDRIVMTDMTRPGMRPFDSVSPASARPSGSRHPSESGRRTPAELAVAPLPVGAGMAARPRFRSLKGPPLTAWRRRRLLLLDFLFRLIAILFYGRNSRAPTPR